MVTASEPGDGELLARWAGGDNAAGSALLDRHFDALFRFFRNKAPEAVEDLIQDTMLACSRGKDGFRGDASFRTYLFTIARHELYAHFAKRVRPTENTADIGSLSVADLGTSPSGAVARRRDLQLLLRALRTLPLDLQVALELHYFEDMSGSEMAEVLGVPEGTIRSRLRRGREAVRASMEELAEAGDEGALEASQRDIDAWARSVARSPDDG